ncbi:MAG: hypothetical protein A07HN63_00062 [uncultured archaeon A07HN63]|nr:MAG: hypothetical protein A07HN63_00062 [uncultured archaeon A07HN63]
MGLLERLRRMLVDDAGEERAPRAREPADSDTNTTIEDAEATSLRAIKLPSSERETVDATDREREKHP